MKIIRSGGDPFSGGFFLLGSIVFAFLSLGSGRVELMTLMFGLALYNIVVTIINIVKWFKYKNARAYNEAIEMLRSDDVKKQTLGKFYLLRLAAKGFQPAVELEEKIREYELKTSLYK